MIIHEVIQEVMTSSIDSYAIQLGAFMRKANADAFRKKLAALLGKEVEIFVEDGFYKVRILGFETRKEVDDFIPILNRNGVNEMWVITLRGMQKYFVITTRQDTITETIETVTESEVPTFRADLNVQVGAFRDSSRADALSRKVSASIDRPVIIVREDGYYKVRVTGFLRPEDREELVPILGLLGFTDTWLMPVKKPLVQPSVVEPVKEPVKEVIIETKPDSTAKEPVKEAIIATKPDTTAKETEKKIEITPPPEPTVSLQVAVFRRKIQAIYAQRRIINKLKLPVEVVQEYDYYKVIVTGFYTREESYKYYPQLTELGYSNIYMIIKK